MTNNSNNRTALLKEIKEEVIHLEESSLCAERIKNKGFPVIGEGSHYAKIMFIGEAPGKNEAATGRPFCGTAGRILDELLDSIQIKREDIYITNIIKDRPPMNRDPSPEEIKMYAPFLDRQINIIKPKVIVALGRFSMEYIMRNIGLEEEIKPISQIHGKIFETETGYGKIDFLPLYHPAVAIYNPNTLGNLKKDFNILQKYAKIFKNN